MSTHPATPYRATYLAPECSVGQLWPLVRPPVGGAPLARWYMAGPPPKGGLIQKTGCDREMASEKTSPVLKNFTIVVGTKKTKRFAWI